MIGFYHIIVYLIKGSLDDMIVNRIRLGVFRDQTVGCNSLCCQSPFGTLP